MEQKICHIIGAGEFFENKITRSENDLVIAADGGIDHLKSLGIAPDLIIGDFDSADEKNISGNVIKLPKEKNDTDMLAAINLGLEKGFKFFHIYGGTGGRFSHTLANIHCLAHLAENGAQGFLHGKSETTTVIKNSSISFDKNHKGYVSVFAYAGDAVGVTLTGLKYPLDNFTVTCDYPIGASNEFLEIESIVSVKNGFLIVVF